MEQKMDELINTESIKSIWEQYYILDSINHKKDIPTYPVNYDENYLLYILNSMIVLDLIVYNEFNKQYQLTPIGSERLALLYKKLNLNKYNRHIYPNIFDLL